MTLLVVQTGFALLTPVPYEGALQQITGLAMRLSRYFLPLLKETPSEAQIVSHRLMLRAGMIRQEAAGIYAWLPLGFRVLQKIEQIVREEMDRAGAIEILMPTLQPADLWRESGRYDAYGKEMLRIKDRHERDLLYGPDQRGDDHRHLPQLCAIVQGPAAEPLPHRSGNSATRSARASASCAAANS